jgi:hypothetical protein
MAALLATFALAACDRDAPAPTAGTGEPQAGAETASYASQHANDYAVVPLTADLSAFDADGQRMIAHLVQASQVMDDIYWRQSWDGDRAELLARAPDQATRDLVTWNFGPWDRLNEDAPILEGIGPRPPGGMFYPADMTREQFEAADLADKTSWYTLLRRDDAGALVTVPYHEAYADDLQRAATHLRAAADVSADAQFAEYLRMRADALLDDDFQPSDMAWMDMKSNPVDVVIGPIESYDDQLFGYKAAYEGLVLIKDMDWSERLSRYAGYLPELQRGLPVDDRYKAETPGSDADLNAYTVVYYGGNANVGGKTIAINLPNDPEVQLAKGTRRLQLENVMRAKFDKIMVPIANELIAEDQVKHVTFEAFFQNTMFHEVAHGLGVKNTLDGSGTVTDALKDQASSFEEGKADILGLYMVDSLARRGLLDDDSGTAPTDAEVRERLMDNYVTFLAGIMRSVRFGAGSAHGKANMVRFNFFAERGAFVRDPETGRYSVDFEKMRAATDELGGRLLTIQGDGDYTAAVALTEQMGNVGPELASDLKRLEQADIPVDIRFEQGLETLGLEAYAVEATPAGDAAEGEEAAPDAPADDGDAPEPTAAG